MRLKHTWLLVAVLALACKTRSGVNTLREAEGAPEDAPADASDPSGTPLQSAQMSAGAFATDTCFGSSAAAWATGPAAFASPEFVPPGTTRFVRPDVMTSANANWTVTAHGDVAGLDVLTAKAETFAELLDRLASADQGAVNWHLGQAFGRALATALADAPADLVRYGVVALRKTLNNQRLAGDAPAPQGVANAADAYARCGDGYLTGRVVTDNLFYLFVGKDIAKRDAATAGLRDLALNRGDFDANLTAVEQATRNGILLFALETDASTELKFVAREPAAIESVINAWRGNTAPTGIRSLLGAATPYPVFNATTSPAATTNAALRSLALSRNALRGLAGTDKTTAQTQADALATAIAACGGKRFTPACDAMGGAVAAVAAQTQTQTAPAAQLPAINAHAFDNSLYNRGKPFEDTVKVLRPFNADHPDWKLKCAVNTSTAYDRIVDKMWVETKTFDTRPESWDVRIQLHFAGSGATPDDWMYGEGFLLVDNRNMNNGQELTRDYEKYGASVWGLGNYFFGRSAYTGDPAWDNGNQPLETFGWVDQQYVQALLNGSVQIRLRRFSSTDPRLLTAPRSFGTPAVPYACVQEP